MGNNVFSRVPNGRAGLCLYPILFAFLLLGACGGGSGSSPTPEPDPVPPIQNIMVYQDEVAEGQPMSLYVLNREGESMRVSEDTGGATVLNHAVSPDESQVAYWYSLGDQELALVIVALNDPRARPTRLVIEGIPSGAAVKDWLQWLPDSKRVLYTTGGLQRYDYTDGLWLLSLGSEQPVQLVAAQPEHDTYLVYSVSADGSRVAVIVNYWDSQHCCEVASSALYLVDLETSDEPRLMESASGNANTIEADWSPTGHELLFQRRMRRMLGGLVDTASGPLMLLGNDSRSYTLWEGNNEPGTRWLDPGRILVGLNGGFEMIGTDGRVLASHVGTGSRLSTEAGAMSVVASPDARWLAFLDWTNESDIEVYLLNLETAEERVVGPANSQRIIWHDIGPPRYDTSELHWSVDSSWLAWNRKSPDNLEEHVYAHAVTTSQTRLVAEDAMFWGFGDDPWVTDGNVLEYRLRRADSGNAFYALAADDLDSGQPLFAVPYPMSPLTVTDTQSGQTLTVTPSYLCNRTWLGNGDVFWNGCDGNTYLSRIAGQTLNDTLLIARGTAWLTLVSRNQEIFLLSPVYPETSWQLYDYPHALLLKPIGPISSRFYTWLM